MKANIIRIGNSRGIRIPKAFLEQAGLQDDVEIEVRGRQIVVHAPKDPRAGWKEAFAAMARAGDDALLDPKAKSTKWDDTEWTW
jgi:antitoxin MazE